MSVSAGAQHPPRPQYPWRAEECAGVWRTVWVGALDEGDGVAGANFPHLQNWKKTPPSVCVGSSAGCCPPAGPPGGRRCVGSFSLWVMFHLSHGRRGEDLQLRAAAGDLVHIAEAHRPLLEAVHVQLLAGARRLGRSARRTAAAPGAAVVALRRRAQQRALVGIVECLGEAWCEGGSSPGQRCPQ